MQRLTEHRHVFGVFIAFALAVAVVPTFADVAIHDDWVYGRVARDLVRDGQLRIPEASAVYAIFDGAWGALFSLPFGFSLGAIRFASVVLLALGGLAFYGLALELGARRERAALGTAVYLFNPLTFVLAFTYMTDTHVMAVLTMATYFYVRAWRRGRLSDALVASAFVTLALLSRNTAIVAAVAAAAYAFVRREWRHGIAAAALPLAVAMSLQIWFSSPRQMKTLQRLIGTRVSDPGATWEATLVVAFVALAYVGLLGLPLLVSSKYRLPRRPAAWAVLAGAVAILVNGLVGRFAPPQRMPYVGDWIDPGGLGPLAMLGNRAALPGWVWAVVTVVAVLGALGAAWIISSTRSGVVVWIGAVLLLAVVPAGFIFMPPLDRYFVIVLPVALGLLAAARTGPRLTVLGWGAAGLMALYAVAGTHDYLTTYKTTWNLAEDAVRDGVRLTQLDAGAGWVGWHWATESGVPIATPNPPWWIGWGPEVDSTYVISTESPPPGYSVVRNVHVGTWLTGPDRLVLSRRQG